MYQIQNVATGQHHRNTQGEPIQWETRGEATKFAQLNYPEQLASGEVTVVRVFRRLYPTDSTDSVYLRSVRAILGMMSVEDRWAVLQGLFDSLNQQTNTKPDAKPQQEGKQKNQHRDL